MTLQAFKVKDVGAQQGHKLLKSKADALKVRFREICKKIYLTKVGMSDQSGQAFFSMTQAEYAAGNFRNKVIEAHHMTAQVRVSSRTDNVAGVKLPVFSQYDTGAEPGESLGLGGGGRKIVQCKEKFGEYLKALITVASLQTSFLAMDEALKITNRRVNALENVTLPKIKTVIDYINKELDELEREDFTRLKMVKKKKEAAIKAAEMAAAEAAAADEDLSAAPKFSGTPSKGFGVEGGEEEVKTEKKKGKKKKAAAAESALSAFAEEDDDVVFR